MGNIASFSRHFRVIFASFSCRFRVVFVSLVRATLRFILEAILAVEVGFLYGALLFYSGWGAGCVSPRPPRPPLPLPPVVIEEYVDWTFDGFEYTEGVFASPPRTAISAVRTAKGSRLRVASSQPSVYVMIDADHIDYTEDQYAYEYELIALCVAGQRYCALRETNYGLCYPYGWGPPVGYISVTWEGEGDEATLTVAIPQDLGSYEWVLQTCDANGLVHQMFRGSGLSWTSEAIDFGDLPPGVPVDRLGDFDGDGDVDLEDYFFFRWCGDLDGDGDFDLADFAVWQNIFTGA